MRINRFARKFATVFLGAMMGLTLLGAAPASAAGPANGVEFKAFSFWFDIGNLSNTNSCIPSYASVKWRDPNTGHNMSTPLKRSNGNGCTGDQLQLSNWGNFQQTHSTVNLLTEPVNSQRLLKNQLTSVVMTVHTPNTPVGRQKNIKVTKFTFDALDTNNVWHRIVDHGEYVYHETGNDKELFVQH